MGETQLGHVRLEAAVEHLELVIAVAPVGPDVLEKGRDGLGLMGKALDQLPLRPVRIVGQRQLRTVPVGAEVVLGINQVQRLVQPQVTQDADEVAALGHATELVQAAVEHRTLLWPAEGGGIAADDNMLVDHQQAHPGVTFDQHRRTGQAGDPGTDEDRVPGRLVHCRNPSLSTQA